MTIRITVKNEDNRETAVIGVQQKNKDGGANGQPPERSLKGGESVELYVHDSQNVLVREIGQ